MQNACTETVPGRTSFTEDQKSSDARMFWWLRHREYVFSFHVFRKMHILGRKPALQQQQYSSWHNSRPKSHTVVPFGLTAFFTREGVGWKIIRVTKGCVSSFRAHSRHYDRWYSTKNEETVCSLYKQAKWRENRGDNGSQTGQGKTESLQDSLYFKWSLAGTIAPDA